ncbi:MAG: peptidoglycan DD-metalloendopeptidase family protein [Chlorobiaceae bacterium]|nr:peptidoglycan DD-metalloendopeptidase family protein [Chlorobiaceae bacterium]
MHFFSANRSIPVSVICILWTCFILAGTFSIDSVIVQAADSDMNRIVSERHRVENTLKDLRRQLDDYQSKLKNTKKNEIRSQEALKNIRNQIGVYEHLISKNQVLLGHLDAEIAQLQKQLEQNRERYHQVSTDFRSLAIATYKRGGDRNAELLFSSGSVGDAVARAKYMGFLSRTVKSKVNDLQSSAQEMENSRSRLAETYRLKESAMKAQKDQLLSYSSKQKEKEVVLTGIRKDKQAYAARIVEVRKQQRLMQSRIESLIMAQQELIRKEQERSRQEVLRRQRLARQAESRRKMLQQERQEVVKSQETPAKGSEKTAKPLPSRKEELRREPLRPDPAAQPTAPSTAATATNESLPVIVDDTESQIDRVSADFDEGGSLPWPVSGGVIVRRFGSSLDKELNIVTISNGIDISVPSGTSVKSVSGGKVVQITYLPTFGNVVIVRHPKSYLTVYANLGRVSVSRGEIIRSRQLLGISTAMPEGGSFVHFEVWKGRNKQNPQNWLR